MKVSLLCIDEGPDSYKSKKGEQVTSHRLTLMDMGTDKRRCATQFQLNLSEDQKAQAGQFRDKWVEVEVHEIRPGFGSFMNLRGTVELIKTGK